AGLLLAVALELGPPAQPVAAAAAALLATRAGLELVPWLDVPWDNTFAVFSPSQNYSYPFLLLTVLLIARFLRQGGLRTLAPLAVLLLLGSGVKATTLPVVLSGLLLAVAVSVVCRAPWRRAALLASVAAVALAVGTVVIGAGGSTGSGVQLLSTLRRNAVYHEFIGLSATQARVAGGLVLPGLALPGAALVAALLLWATVLKYLWVLPGAAVLGVRRGQVDPVAWFLLGGGLSGWLLMLLVDQSGLSQVYFLSTGVVLWFLLAAWGLVELWHRATEQHGRVRTTRVVLASSLAAAVLARLLGLLSPERPALDGTAAGLAVVLVPAAVIFVAVGAVVLVQARSGGGALGGLALGAGLVAVSIAGTVVLTATPTEAREPGRNAVTAAETSAARWLAERAGAHDVVATNVHCLRPRANAPCDARAFWVSALTRRRVFIGGWAYLDETRAAAARRGPPGVDQPFHDQEAFRLNERLFTDPTPETATELRRRGVTWVFADVRRGEVSDRLAQVAQLVHSTADVDVYRLAPVALPSP
ncbi:MAG TPA: hypothetical protein VES93_06225, partial [Ornithinibacter sp.]|nr:hypothetical protein [Ornithinibacter sp.]